MLMQDKMIVINIRKNAQTKREELLNTITHLIGLLFSIIALILMVVKALEVGHTVNIIAVSVFGASLISMYVSSSLYHGVSNLNLKKFLRKVDHVNIYVLIAGTYTPITLIALSGVYGWLVCALLWGAVIAGFIYKVFFFGDGWLSIALYITMGWIAVGFIVQIFEALPVPCLMWIILGGSLYTCGVFFYMLDKDIEFCHFFWHLFVLGGSSTHFFAIYLYIAGM